MSLVQEVDARRNAPAERMSVPVEPLKRMLEFEPCGSRGSIIEFAPPVSRISVLQDAILRQAVSSPQRPVIRDGTMVVNCVAIVLSTA